MLVPGAFDLPSHVSFLGPEESVRIVGYLVSLRSGTGVDVWGPSSSQGPRVSVACSAHTNV